MASIAMSLSPNNIPSVQQVAGCKYDMPPDFRGGVLAMEMSCKLSCHMRGCHSRWTAWPIVKLSCVVGCD